MIKHKNSLLLLILLVVNIFISGIGVYFSINSTKAMPELKNNNTKEMLLFNQINASIENNHTYLSNLTLDEYLAKENLNNAPILIIKYSFFGCKSCSDYIVAKIKEHIPNYQDNPNVLFVASDFDVLRSKYGQTLLLKDGENLGLSFDATNIPYVFIYDKGEVKHFFVPDSGIEDALILYLKSIVSKYKI